MVIMPHVTVITLSGGVIHCLANLPRVITVK